ncbi:unnamed protein product [Effrenium voratum]|uniref:Uncharacterized protein n=1 Tax=Effrenium voratum TaxID=2562239 RepID=A0AA36IF08_9DINO|nr:unnamed protein product [Effrenium voratum]
METAQGAHLKGGGLAKSDDAAPANEPPLSAPVAAPAAAPGRVGSKQRPVSREHGSKTLADFVTGSKSLAELVEVVAPSRVDTEAIMGQELEIEHPWARFAVKLLETTGDEIEQVPSREQEDILKMKPVWKIPLSQVPGTARMYEVSLMSPDHTLRINNALTDDSWLQQYVVGPRSRWQLFWSSIATILILWDLITIPLEMYSVPELNEVLDGVGIFSFCFWTLDIPHLSSMIQGLPDG